AGSGDSASDHRHTLRYGFLDHPRLAFPPARMKQNVECRVKLACVFAEPGEKYPLTETIRPRQLRDVLSKRPVPDEDDTCVYPCIENELQGAHERLWILLGHEPADPSDDLVTFLETKGFACAPPTCRKVR